MFQNALIKLQLFLYLGIAFKDLDGVPSLLFLRQAMNRDFFDMRKGVLHRAGEGMLRNGLCPFRGGDGRLRGGFGSLALQRRDFHDPAAELTAELFDIDAVALPTDQVHHVQGNHHRNADLHQLCGQVEVAFQVRRVDDVQDNIGAFLNQIITRNHLFQRIGREGVDARQVCYDNVFVVFQASFLLLNRDARPVADKLVRAGQGIEQRCLAAVRIAREGNADLFFHLISPLL